MSLIRKIILWVSLGVSISFFLLDRKILFSLLNSFWSGQILFSAKFWTFAAVIVALFGKHFNDWLNQPIICLDFDYNSDRCYKNAVLNEDVLQDFGRFYNVTRQYFRLKVSNAGNDVASKVRIVLDLYYNDGKEAERFEPNCLRWMTGEKEIDIASGETTYINLLSQIIKISESGVVTYAKNLFVLRWEVCDYTPRGVAWDRESRIFKIKLVVHGANVKTKTFWFRFIPDAGDKFQIGKLVKVNNIQL